MRRAHAMASTAPMLDSVTAGFLYTVGLAVSFAYVVVLVLCAVSPKLDGVHQYRRTLTKYGDLIDFNGAPIQSASKMPSALLMLGSG